MDVGILKYNKTQAPRDRAICDLLASLISRGLRGAEGRIWHGHPVWFLEGNPIVGYSKQKPGIRLMFWSGADFGEPGLDVVGRKFKDASVVPHRPAPMVDARPGDSMGLSEHRQATGQTRAGAPTRI